MASYRQEVKNILDGILLQMPSVRSGKMFGFPAYFAGQKLCICLYENGVGVKLPEASAKQLLAADSNVHPFQPYGKRKMREWVQIDLKDPAAYETYLPIFAESVRYVASQQEVPDGI